MIFCVMMLLVIWQDTASQPRRQWLEPSSLWTRQISHFR